MASTTTEGRRTTNVSSPPPPTVYESFAPTKKRSFTSVITFPVALIIAGLAAIAFATYKILNSFSPIFAIASLGPIGTLPYAVLGGVGIALVFLGSWNIRAPTEDRS